jgi:hypothetical protein
MAYGIEVKNSSGSTIIDSGTDSYQIIEMGVVGGYPVPQDSLGFYGTTNPGYAFFQEQDLDSSAMVFYRPLKTDPHATVTVGNTTYPAIMIMTHARHISNRQVGLISGENYWHGLGNIRWGYVSNTSTNRIKFADFGSSSDPYPDVTVTEGDPIDYLSVEYCVAQKARTFSTPTSGYGMTLTDNSGNLTYSTEYPCARIRAARGTQTSSSNEALGTFYQASNYGEAMNLWVGGGLDNFYKYNRTFTDPQYRDEYWYRYIYYDYVNNRIRFGMHETADDPSPTNSGSLATGNNFSTHIKNEILGIMI